MRRVAAVSFIIFTFVSCSQHWARLRHAPGTPVARADRADPDKADKDEFDEPEEAARYFISKRVLEGDELPTERYFEAIERTRRMPVYSTRLRRFNAGPEGAARLDASLGDWTYLGPGNIGGRTRAFVIHPTDPNTMYAGGVAGGIWKSTDAGASWTPLNDFLANLTVSALAFDPANPDTLYAGTGEQVGSPGFRGGGIFKSTDAGATWTRLEATNSSRFYYVNQIVVSPNNSARVYASTYGGVWRSLNGGSTWTITLDRTSPNNGCQDLVIRTDQKSDYLFAACGINVATNAIFRNTDAGGSASWVQVHTDKDMGYASLALAPSDQSVIYAMAASLATGDARNGLLAVYRSTRNGDPGTWDARVRSSDPTKLNTLLLTNPFSATRQECARVTSTITNQGSYDNVLAVDPLDPNRVWAGGIDLFRSDDGAATWGIASHWWAQPAPQFSHADQHRIVFHPNYDGAGNQTMYVASDGGLYRTDNARAETGKGERATCAPDTSSVKWTSLNNNYGVTQFYAGTVYPGGTLYFGGAQDNGTLRGGDGAGSNLWSEIVGGDGGYVAVDPTNVNTIYAETTRLNFRKSINGGRTFATTAASTTGITEPSDDFPFIARFVIDPNEPKRLWIGGKKLWRTENAAGNWTQTSPAVSDGTVSAIAIAPGDSNRVLAGSSGGFIHRTSSGTTSDGAGDWPAVQPRRGFVSGLAFDPNDSNKVYATYSTFNALASDRHIYASSDGGATWNAIDGTGNGAFPDIPANAIVVDPANSGALYVGTDLGVFVSLDGGASWSKEQTGFPNTVVEALALDSTSGSPTLFAFTHGRGVWRVRLGGGACAYAASTGSVSVPASGGESRIQVATDDACSWSAITSAAWITLTTPNGKGSSDLRFNAATNPGASARSATIMLADGTVTVDQPGANAVANNDESSTAAPIAALPYAAVEDTRPATGSTADPVHSCTNARDSKTVWFRFTAPFSGNVQASASGYALVLTAYPVAVTLGRELGCQQRPLGQTAAVRFPVTNGEQYLIEVSGTGTSSGGGNLVFTLEQVN